MNGYPKTTLNLSQVGKISNQEYCGPRPKYITVSCLGWCTFPEFPMFFRYFPASGLSQVLWVGDPNVLRTLGMLPWSLPNQILNQFISFQICRGWGGNRKRTWMCSGTLPHFATIVTLGTICDNHHQMIPFHAISLTPKTTHSYGAWRNHQTVALQGSWWGIPHLVRVHPSAGAHRFMRSRQIKPQPTVIDYIPSKVSSVGDWIHLFLSSFSISNKVSENQKFGVMRTKLDHQNEKNSSNPILLRKINFPKSQIAKTLFFSSTASRLVIPLGDGPSSSNRFWIDKNWGNMMQPKKVWDQGDNFKWWLEFVVSTC